MSKSFRDHPAARVLSALLVLSMGLLGCPPPNVPLAPRAGTRQYEAPLLVPLPGACQLNAAGGNAIISRTDLTIDTKLGVETASAAFNLATTQWMWNFEMTYDGTTFVDPTGASFNLSTLANGAAIPGTTWLKVDATHVGTKGGMIYEFAATGRLAARYWVSATYPRIRYTTAQIAGVTRTTDVDQCTSVSSCSDVVSLSYDSGTAELVSMLDRAGRQAQFTWTSGDLTSARDPLDVQQSSPGRRYEYSSSTGRIVATVSSENERVEFAYSGARLASVTQLGLTNPVTNIYYEGRDSNQVYHTRVVNPAGEETRYGYDGGYRAVEVKDVATSVAATWTWGSGAARPSSMVRPGGVTTSWTYTGDDVATRTDSSGNVTTYTYRAGGENRGNPTEPAVLTAVDSIGAVETRGYDAQGRLTSITNGAGNVTTALTYNSGNLVATLTLDGVMATLGGYGDHGHPTTVTSGGTAHTRLYDAVGNRTRGPAIGTVEEGGIYLRTFDADRNIASQTLIASSGAQGSVSLTWRSNHLLASVSRPNGEDHQFVYDVLGRPSEQREKVNGAWVSTTTEYDAASRVAAVGRANGMREEYTWASGNRITNSRFLRNSTVETTLAFTYTNGRLTRLDDSSYSGPELIAYDFAGRPSETTFPSGDKLVRTFDGRSRLANESFVVPPGNATLASIDYDYDLADRRTEIADATGVLLATDYNANGQVASMTYGNGLERSYTYSSGILTATDTVDAQQDAVEQTQILRGVAAAFITSYTGEDLGQFAVEEQHYYSPIPSGQDPTTNAGQRVTSSWDGTTLDTYEYDSKSNLLSAGGFTFDYNAERNRMLAVRGSGGALVRSYAYDAAGFATQRGTKALTWTATGKLASYGTDTFAWDAFRRPVSATVDGTLARWRFGGRVNADAAGNATAIDLGDVVIRASGNLYRHFDFRGNVSFVSNVAGQVITQYQYNPYGVEQVFGDTSDPVRFVGRTQVKELMFLGARVYDPEIGRFLSPDPLFQTVNQFAYALGNPVAFSDPDGTNLMIVLEIALTLGGGAASFAAALYATSTVAAYFYLSMAIMAAIYAALLIDQAINGNGALAPPGGGSGGGPGGGGGGGTGGGPSGGCSPAAMASSPNVAYWLWFLLPLQALLGLALLRRRRNGGAA